MIRLCRTEDFDSIWTIINDGAQAYKGVIPADRWHEPYMTRDELRREIDAGVVFWGYEGPNELQAVMGIQPVLDVTLIRHAYVRTSAQRLGLGARLLSHLRQTATTPILVGTWADARWAISFYQKHGFRLVSPAEAQQLLQKYWNIPQRQVETSVVLARSSPASPVNYSA